MRHQTDDPEIYGDSPVQFYDGAQPRPVYSRRQVGSWQGRAYPRQPALGRVQIIKTLAHRGKPATDPAVSNDVGSFLMEGPWIQCMTDNRRADYGAINPEALAEYVISLGRFNLCGRKLEIFVNDGTFEDRTGADTPFLAAGSAIVTAPNCGMGRYGAVTQKEIDSKWHTHAGMRIPNYLSTIKPPVDETGVSSRPLFAPKG